MLSQFIVCLRSNIFLKNTGFPDIYIRVIGVGVPTNVSSKIGIGTHSSIYEVLHNHYHNKLFSPDSQYYKLSLKMARPYHKAAMAGKFASHLGQLCQDEASTPHTFVQTPFSYQSH